MLNFRHRLRTPRERQTRPGSHNATVDSVADPSHTRCRYFFFAQITFCSNFSSLPGVPNVTAYFQVILAPLHAPLSRPHSLAGLFDSLLHSVRAVPGAIASLVLARNFDV